jgi:hypothetical protein
MVIEITIEKLIGSIVFDKTSHKRELMHQIFWGFQEEYKDAKSISSNCLNLEMV